MKDWTVAQVKAASRPGAWRVSKNLYLQVEEAARGGVTKSWVFRYQQHGRAHNHGLGSIELVSLAEARDKALACRKMLLDGVDPIEARKAEQLKAKLASASAMTFRACAERYIASHRAGWTNGKHAEQWESTLPTYAEPVIGDLPVSVVDTAMVMKILEPIWTTKPETASRVRGRIEAVLGWASARGYRTGDNPARWRNHLDTLLPARGKVAKVQHHAALPYDQLPGFMVDLRAQTGTAARCLEFTILTAARTGEAIGAQWTEFDFRAKTWTVPGARMKAGKAHVVPLGERAIEILTNLPRTGDFVFEGVRTGQPLSNTAMLMLMRRRGRCDLTTHGFRSTFRDWTAERTSYPRAVAEMALAHTIGDKVEAAYRRGDLLAKRRRLMADWSRYCTTPPRADSTVVDSRSGAAS